MKKQRIHFMGIGGIGMSAIAHLCLQRGARVSGCDIGYNKQTERLQREGVVVELGHDPTHIANERPDILVHSSAVPPHDEELSAARAAKVEILSRAAMLARLLEDKTTIAVAGSHGKTTTTGIIAELLLGLELDPSVMVGGVSPVLGANFRHGGGEYFVSEVDESDGSLLQIHPQLIICTNVDREHLDFYRDWAHIEEVFLRFFKQSAEDGVLVGWGGDRRLRSLFKKAGRTTFYYGFEKRSDLRIENPRYAKGGTTFDLACEERTHTNIRLNLAGEHNLLNAVGALGVLHTLGVEIAAAVPFLKNLSGVKRRFEKRGSFRGVTVVEDYAHHPREIAATLEVAKLHSPKRIIAVFQPHRYTRVKGLYREFIRCFAGADAVVLMDIYSANEEPLAGVSSQHLASGVRRHLDGEVYHIPNRDAVVDFVKSYATKGDMVLFLGAGDIGKLPAQLL